MYVVCSRFSFGKIFLDSWLFYCPVLTTLYSMFSTSRKGVLSASMCALLTQPSAFNQGACPIPPSFLQHWSLVLGRVGSKKVCWNQKRRTECQYLGRKLNETTQDIRRGHNFLPCFSKGYQSVEDFLNPCISLKYLMQEIADRESDLYLLQRWLLTRFKSSNNNAGKPTVCFQNVIFFGPRVYPIGSTRWGPW